MHQKISPPDTKIITTHLILTDIPIKIVSEANNHEHWTAKYKRKISNNRILDCHWPSELSIKLPILIIFTRVAPRALDSDNLIHAFKNIRDYVCDKIVPGKAIGRADSSDLFSFEYQQIKSPIPKKYSINIEIYEDI